MSNVKKALESMDNILQLYALKTTFGFTAEEAEAMRSLKDTCEKCLQVIDLRNTCDLYETILNAMKES